MDAKRRNLVYKTATFLKETGDGGATLQKLLQQAIKKTPKALDRSENPEAGSEYRFLNYTGTHIKPEDTTSLFGCEFLSYEQGADQSTIKIDMEATQVDLDAMIASKGEEFLAGAVYFGVIDNNVVLVQSKALRTLDVEKYLNWFLVQKTKVLSDDNRVSLCDHVPTKKKVFYGDVKGIEIAAPVHLQPVITKKQDESKKADNTKGEAKKYAAVKFGGKAWDALQTLLGDAFDLPKEMNVHDATHAPEIELKMYLSWKASKIDSDQEFMGAIAKNMSHVDDEFDYAIHTKTGKITKDDFKIFKPQNINWGKGRPQLDDIFPKMALWLAELVESGKISS